MPLDGHAYLVAQGWTGSGSGLRNGAISRPVITSQKKTLSGIGKDRDEAFPFWDHLYTAAAKAIKVKIVDSDNESEGTETPSAITIERTRTGIISNRRPVDGTSAKSAPDPSGTRNLSVLSTAKREAAKRGLYSMFLCGPILRPDEERTVVEPGVKEEIGMKTETYGGQDQVVVVEGQRAKKKHKLKDVTEDSDDRQKSKKRKREARSEQITKEKKQKDKSESSDIVPENMVLEEDVKLVQEKIRRSEEKRAKRERKGTKKMVKLKSRGEDPEEKQNESLVMVVRGIEGEGDSEQGQYAKAADQEERHLKRKRRNERDDVQSNSGKKKKKKKHRHSSTSPVTSPADT